MEQSSSSLKSEFFKAFGERLLPGAPERLWLEMGRALWMIQSAEGTLLTINFLLSANASMSQPEREECFQKFRDFTLGQVLDRLLTSTSIDPTIQAKLKLLSERLKKLGEERNWLAHRILEEHHRDLLDPQRFAALLNRLDHVRENAASLDLELRNVLEDVNILRPTSDLASGINGLKMFAWTFGDGPSVLPQRRPKKKKSL